MDYARLRALIDVWRTQSFKTIWQCCPPAIIGQVSRDSAINTGEHLLVVHNHNDYYQNDAGAANDELAVAALQFLSYSLYDQSLANMLVQVVVIISW